MQYTGLKDKNGTTEIYENDLCRDGETIYQIVWVDTCAKWGAKVIKTKYVLTKNLTFPLQNYMDFAMSTKFEVIGNIYETPELLKGDSNVSTS